MRPNGVPAVRLESPSKSDPFEDLSLRLLAVSQAPLPVHPAPVLTPGPKGVVPLPPATSSNISILSSVSCMPTLPPLPVRSQSQENVRCSPNPFAPAFPGTDLFAGRTNPFRAPSRDAEAAAAQPVEPVPCPALPPPGPRGQSSGKPPAQPPGFQDSSGPPRGWVTFEEEEDFGVSAKLKAACPDSLGPWPGPSSGPGVTLGDDWGQGTGVPTCVLPSRRPPPPPGSVLPAGPAPPADPFTALAPVAPAVDFTER